MGIYDCSTLTIVTTNDILRRVVILRKNNLVVCEYGVFKHVFYQSLRWLINVTIEFVFESRKVSCFGQFQEA